MNRVLFACVQNAGRSQMAAAFFNRLADPRLATATSAGTQPAVAVHQEVILAMLEVGIDLTSMTPTFLSEGLAAEANLLVTMGCGEACPVVPGLRRQDWPFEDPKEAAPARIRTIRDAIRERVESLIDREGWR